MRQTTKAIVIGFDGLDPKIAESMLDAGALPHFARLRERGGYARLRTTAPAQTPVAWSTFATGLSPGGHGIFDFLRRDPRRYLPDLALSRYEQRSALLPPRAVNLRTGRTVWELLADHGIPSTVIRCPCTYPAQPFEGRLLSGMGVPDIRGGIGTSSFYSTAATTAGEGESVHVLEPHGRGFRSELTGPRLAPAKSATVQLAIELEDADTARVVLGERGPAFSLRRGAWSAWQRVKFRTGPLMSITGMVRFLLRATSPQVELYASPVNFDPRSAPFPICHPPAYAGDLETDIGAFGTLGMPEDHTGLTNDRFGEDDYLAQCDLVMRERVAMLQHELGRLRRGLLFCLFDTPDRIQHMFWRFREHGHPSNAVHGFDARYQQVIEDHYRRCDDIVGEVLRAVDDDTLLMILSDHGFTSFRRAINLNAWLADTGWLTLRRDASREESHGDFFRDVDWSRTRAYAVGFGGIYLNVAGREAEGVVSPDERAATAARLAGELRGLADPERAMNAISGAQTANELYAGARAAEAPDVLVHCADGYRVSWSTALGGVPSPWFEDNTRKWAGDHIVDPAIVPGVLFLNRSIGASTPHIVDCAPTILASLGVTPQAGLEGRAFT